MINLRPYQQEAKTNVYNAWKSNYRNVLMVLPTGGGKCLGKDTPVLMYDGTVKLAQDVRKGDQLMGPDSKPRNVLSTCIGQSEMFKINPVKGDSWICNDVHILSLKHCQTGKIVDIPLNHYLKESKNFKHLHKQYRVGVDFPTKDYGKIPPYFLGLYLAEGTHCNNSITISDEEIENYLYEFAKDNNLSINDVQGRNCKTLWFSNKVQGWNKNIVKKLRTYCTRKDDRRVPSEYLINNREVRLQVLAGLLDGDGFLHHNGYEIVTKYKTLNDNILYLCRSLGLAAYSKKCRKNIKSTGFEGEYFRITISGHTDMIPLKVKRKKAKSRKQIKNVLHTGINVESIGDGTYYGFELDGDHRFLLGDFTVTHNTKTFTSVVTDCLAIPNAPMVTAIMVHRKELVQQISLTLAEEGVRHNIIASKKDIRGIIAAQRRLHGNNFYKPDSLVTVISVDTLISRQHIYKHWLPTVQQWITDEAAHVLRDNKWGKAIALFTNARGLGVTATPERLDRKGLGSQADGVFDVMVEGPPTAWMIQQGFLSKYKIACPPSDYEQHLTSKSDTSDYSKKVMAQASQKSQIVGDVVDNYVKFADGKQAILFATDVQTAKKMEKRFNERGIPAKSLDGTTPDKERLEGIINFSEKKTRVLINVDLFDEGLDVPGIECVIMARPTKSLGKYLQMVGRGLRLAEGKEYLILIDHVGNVKFHGLPCEIRKWTLDRISKRGQKLSLIRVCSNHMCNSPYDRTLTECPWCGEEAIKKSQGGSAPRKSPEEVDGDLELLDPDTIRLMESRTVLEDPASIAQRVAFKVNPNAGVAAMKRQQERIAAQQDLVKAIANWAGERKQYYGYSDRQIHKRFYLEQGKTITEALGEEKAKMIKTMESL